MRLFGKKDQGPKIKSVHIAGGFSPPVPEQTQAHIREMAHKSLMERRPDYAALWKRAKRSPKDWSASLKPDGDQDMEDLRFQTTWALALAARVDLDTLSRAGSRHFFIDGKAELPGRGPFVWCVQFFFKIED